MLVWKEGTRPSRKMRNRRVRVARPETRLMLDWIKGAGGETGSDERTIAVLTALCRGRMILL